MYGITYDLDTHVLEDELGIKRKVANGQIDQILESVGYVRFKYGTYVCQSPQVPEILVVHNTITALKELPWASMAIKNLVAFKIEDWGDITSCLK